MAISRRDFVKIAGMTAVGVAMDPGTLLGHEKNVALAQAPVVGSSNVGNNQTAGSKAKVYFTKHIDAKSLRRLYDQINEGVYGKVALKLHTGEKNGPYILPRDMVKALQEHIPNSSIVETNTMYGGDRYTTAGHRDTLRVNGWDFCPVDIMDEDGGIELPVRGGKYLQEVTMGGHMVNYDSMVVLTHFKGHTMGGYGGSLKNIAIGCASGQVGKRQVHGYPTGNMPPVQEWAQMPMQDELMERMADSGKATCDYFGKHIIFLNVMRKMSVDCDCAGTAAVKPTIPDIGMLASTDILAIEQASVDLVYNCPEKDRHDLQARIESRHGLHQLQAMRDRKMGNDQYELISID